MYYFILRIIMILYKLLLLMECSSNDPVQELKTESSAYFSSSNIHNKVNNLITNKYVSLLQFSI